MTEYMHGADRTEQERLETMARMLGGASFLPPLSPGMRIVEVGCGTGAIAREVAAMTAPGEVVGVDMQLAQLDTARRLAHETGVCNVRFLDGDANVLDFPDGTFDAAYCRFLLEHVADPVAVVRELGRVVKPGKWVCAFEWENDSHACYPESPAVNRVWEAIYRLQDEMGGHSGIGRRMYSVFTRAGLGDVQVHAHPWTCTGADRDRLEWYIGGAREIVSQMRDGLLERGFVTAELVDEASQEYERLLTSPDAFILEVMCCAVGMRTVGTAS
jgi:ubiquinone/menaquinone biosynthesis C-methylase UbiE